MSAEGFATEPLEFPLRVGRGTVALHAGGMRVRSALRRERFFAYSDVTHLATGPRAIRIGTRKGIVTILRSDFREPAAADALGRALVERIAAEPGGSVQLARMAEIEETLRQPYFAWVTQLLVLACLLGFGLEIWLGPAVHHAGFFNTALALGGEPWRLITANLLHADPVHLALNAIGLALLGTLVERSLGSPRAAFVAGLAALGASGAGIVMGYQALVGASGIVAGFLGALLWIELRYPERLPVSWRISRRLFLVALGLQALADLSLPALAGAAHVGGFFAGGLAAALATGPGLRRESLPRAIALASALVALVVAASIVSAARVALGGAAIESHAARLLELDGLSAHVLNDAAWLIATGGGPTTGALVHADTLAERAVDATERLDPNMLDTLAEVQFQRGDAEAAVETIDEAIALAPSVDYFREQRRRFRGERAASDRPAPPIPFLERRPPGEEPDDLPDPPFDRENPGIAI